MSALWVLIDSRLVGDETYQPLGSQRGMPALQNSISQTIQASPLLLEKVQRSGIRTADSVTGKAVST
jgi:hypothetical protein